MGSLGIELGARALRGVRLEGWYRPQARVVEVEWDPDNPTEAVGALRQHLGPAQRVAMTLDLPLLFVKQVKLPPLSEAEKRNILRLEPERFFAVRAEALLPAVADVVAPFLPAYGAALAIGTKPIFARTLVSPELGARVTARWRRALVLAVAAGIGALVFALASADAWRARATRELETGLQSLRQRAAPALALQSQLEALGREAQAIRQIERGRPDPLGVLLALSKQLPAGAYLRGVRWSGVEWQIDGYAANASRLVAQLGEAPEFKEVRFLSATTRVNLA